MALSKIEIQRIHADKRAIENQIYVEVDGTQYIGDKEGRLEKRTGFNIVLENEVQEQIDDLQEQITDNKNSIEDNKEAIEELDRVKADKCFVIGYTIALG